MNGRAFQLEGDGHFMSIYHTANRYATVEAYYSMTFDQFDMRPHSHPRCEIMYVTRGQCTVHTASEDAVLKTGQFIFIDQRTPHGLSVKKEGPCSIINLEFGCSPAGRTPAPEGRECTCTNGENAFDSSLAVSEKRGLDLCRLKNNSAEFYAFLCRPRDFCVLRDTGSLCYALRDLIYELESGRKGNEFLINILLARTLIECARCAACSDAGTGLIYLKKAQEFIRSNFDQEISVGAVAECAGIHPAYLQKLFKMHLGYGVMQFANMLRLQKASFLLKNTTMKVTEIAFNTGFNSRQHFGYAFEKMFGASPGKYRQIHHLQADVTTDRMKTVDRRK